MALPDTRARLLLELESERFAQLIVSDWGTQKPIILAWWTDLKAEEKKEKFGPVFHDSRMIIRYIKQGVDKSFDMSAHRGLEGEEVETFKRPAPDVTGLSRIKAEIALKNAASRNQHYQLGLGVKQMVERTKPENFATARDGTRQKIELGLYDMSASLLNPASSISGQLFNQPETGNIYGFMPVAAQEDQLVFQKLNALGKRLRESNASFYDLVREIRSKLTRIKLACEHDMATNFTAFAPDNTVNPKFRYGQSATTKGVDPENPGETIKVENTPELINARKLNAINYKAILESEFKYNEITVAFRQHAGDFPLFGVWSKANSVFNVKKLEGGKLVATGATIPDMPLML